MSIISRTLRTGLAAAALIIAAGTASAHEYKLGELHIGHPWARASVNVGGTAGAFLTVENHGSAWSRSRPPSPRWPRSTRASRTRA